ncbi:MAG: type II CAAX endopeptidase family protein [Candidatus Omnitrophota bacterium]
MDVLRNFLKRDWPYCVMAGFLIFVAVMLHAPGRHAPESGVAPEDETYRIEFLDGSVFKERQARLEELVRVNPSVYFLLLASNLGILVLFFGGIFFDAVAVQRWKRGQPVVPRTLDRVSVSWGIPDVIRFALLFYSFAFIFLIAESRIAPLVKLAGSANFGFILNATVIDTVGVLFVLYFVTAVYGQDIRSIGITAKNCAQNICYGLAGYAAIIPALVAAFAVTAMVLAVFKLKPPVQPIVDMLMKEKEVPVLVYSSVFAAVAGPVMEEIFFRGFMYNAFRKRVGVLGGMLVTSAVFSVLHAHAVGFVPIMILGMALVFLYEKTGSLIPSITLHVTHNLASLGLVFFVRMVGV